MNGGTASHPIPLGLLQGYERSAVTSHAKATIGAAILVNIDFVIYIYIDCASSDFLTVSSVNKNIAMSLEVYILLNKAIHVGFLLQTKD